MKAQTLKALQEAVDHNVDLMNRQEQSYAWIKAFRDSCETICDLTTEVMSMQWGDDDEIARTASRAGMSFSEAKIAINNVDLFAKQYAFNKSMASEVLRSMV